MSKPWENEGAPEEQPQDDTNKPDPAEQANADTETPEQPETPEAPEAEEVKPVSEMSVPEIKEQLKALGLPVSGKKDDLIARLEEAQGVDLEAEAEVQEQASIALANLVSRGMSVKDARAHLAKSDVSDVE